MGVSLEKDLPVQFGVEENVRWKAALPAPGNSTPITWRGRVYLTQAVEKGRRRLLLAFDRGTGKVLWERGVDYPEAEPTHDDNPYCSASPATDGRRIVVSHGSAGVLAYDLEGKELWRRDLGKFHHIWGNAASPVIQEGLVFLNCGPGPRSFLAALDAETGKDVWRVDVPGGQEGGDSKTWTGSWSTPLLLRSGARQDLAVSLPGRLLALDPPTGRERWSCAGLGRLVYTSPIVGDGVVVAMSGFMGPHLAVRSSGDGDVTATRRLWHEERAPQRIGSGVVHEGRIYIVNDSGVGQCLDLLTGKEVWKERVGGSSWSSLVLAGGKLYSVDQQGETHVFLPTTRFERIARNPLGERTLSSVAVSDGELFIRTHRHLWCIGRDGGDGRTGGE